jgi:multiple sugar transport system permease protein
MGAGLHFTGAHMNRRYSYKDTLVMLSFLLPSFIGFILFIFGPMVATIVLSFTNYAGGANVRFIGFTNYLSAFRSNSFQQSLWVTLQFVVGFVSISILTALIFALMLNENKPGRNLFRGLFFIPAVLSNIAVGLAFSLLFDVRRGPINQFLVSLGLTPLTFLQSPDTSLATIIFVSVWQQFGYFMVVFLAGLQTINKSLYESANIDGARYLQKLRFITIPMLSPTMFFAVIIAVIRGFQVFDQVFVMTGGQSGGGPRGSTSVIVFNIYQDAFTHFRMGYAAAQATILLLIVLTITVINYQGQKKWVNYDIV